MGEDDGHANKIDIAWDEAFFAHHLRENRHPNLILRWFFNVELAISNLNTLVSDSIYCKIEQYGSVRRFCCFFYVGNFD